jgi:prevent-host-death family protein
VENEIVIKVSVADAKNNLPKLLKSVERGNRITICRRGKAVAEIVPPANSGKKKIKLGFLSGKIIIHDANWWHPMTEKEVEDYLEGRY